jgi:hypothetical protein
VITRRFVHFILVACSVLAALPGSVAAPGPVLNHTLPAGLWPGEPTTIQFVGESLQGARRLWTSFKAGVEILEEEAGPGARLYVSGQTPVSIGAIRLITTNGVSSLRFVLMDPLPPVASFGTNHSPSSAQSLKPPVAVDGGCAELTADFYRIAVRKNQRLTFEVVAQRLGSPLDARLRLLDAQGRELAANDDAAGTDPVVTHTFSASGECVVEIRDTRHQGGPNHRYRLRIGEFEARPLPFLADGMDAAQLQATIPEQEPNDRPTQAQSLALPTLVRGRFARSGDRDLFEFSAQKDQRLVFSGRTRSLGSPCDLFLQVQSTNGTVLAEANVSGADEGSITNTFKQDGRFWLLVEELNRRGGPGFFYELAATPLTRGFTLSVETERVSGPPGSEVEITVTAKRHDFDGPILLRAEAKGPVIEITNQIVAAKSNETKLKITVPEELTFGNFLPFTIVGVAKIDGTNVTARASTVPALRTIWPEMPYPPAALDGSIALGVSENKSATPAPSRKKKKK